MQTSQQTGTPPFNWVSLGYSIRFFFSRKRFFALSGALICATILLTWLGYFFSIDYIDSLTGTFFTTPPATDSIWGWIKHIGWIPLKWLFLIITRIVTFYLAFVLAYSLTTPGYVILSTVAEKLHAGQDFQAEDAITFRNLCLDLFEGIKIGLLGILVTIVALVANFIPGIGQAVVFFLYTYYSALMFVDYPASRRRWSLGRKIGWLKTHPNAAFRLGFLPALVSMVPLLNIFLMALMFPLLTVHTTLNFVANESPLPAEKR